MTPIHQAIAELRLVVGQAERRAIGARAEVLGSQGPDAARHALEDLHAAIHGDLCDALDRIDSGLGTKLFTALHGDVALVGEGS